MTNAEAKKLGVGAMALSRMVARGELYAPERGVYTHSLEWLTDPLKKYVAACARYPQAIISGISALSYYDLTDEEERRIWVTIPVDQSIRNQKYRATRSQGVWYALGVQTFLFGTRRVRIYDREKTVIDACKYQPEEVAHKALKAYLGREDANIRKLSRYAEQLGKPLAEKVRFFLTEA